MDKKQRSITAKELKKALISVPNDLIVLFGSDTEEDHNIIIELARRVTYYNQEEELIDYFEIYGNTEEEKDGE